jgi:hypothetical protein
MNVDRARPRFAEISTAFPTVPESVAAARRFVAATLRRFEFSEPAREQAVLVTSELVASAFATGRPPIRLRVRSLADGRALVEVTHGTDDEADAGADSAAEGTDPAGDGGANLRLTPAGRAVVESFATRWGSRPAGAGVLAWFEISDAPSAG